MCERERKRGRERECEREAEEGAVPGGARGLLFCTATPAAAREREREFFIDNLLVQIHLIVEMILVDRPCVMGV